MNRARTYHCTRMRHCIEQSNGLVPSLLCPSWVDCIIATRGYDFRKGQPTPGEKRDVLDPFDGLADPAFVVRLFACFGQNATPPGAVFLTNPPCAQAARG